MTEMQHTAYDIAVGHNFGISTVNAIGISPSPSEKVLDVLRQHAIGLSFRTTEQDTVDPIGKQFNVVTPTVATAQQLARIIAQAITNESPRNVVQLDPDVYAINKRTGVFASKARRVA